MDPRVDFEDWAVEYFGRGVDVPEACRDAWNAATQARVSRPPAAFRHTPSDEFTEAWAARVSVLRDELERSQREARRLRQALAEGNELASCVRAFLAALNHKNQMAEQYKAGRATSGQAYQAQEAADRSWEDLRRALGVFSVHYNSVDQSEKGAPRARAT